MLTFMYHKKNPKNRNNIVVKPWFDRLKIGTPKVILKKEHLSVQWPKGAQKNMYFSLTSSPFQQGKG